MSVFDDLGMAKTQIAIAVEELRDPEQRLTRELLESIVAAVKYQQRALEQLRDLVAQSGGTKAYASIPGAHGSSAGSAGDAGSSPAEIQCQHLPNYDLVTLTSYPPQHRWTCVTCGVRGCDVIEHGKVIRRTVHIL